MTKRALCSSALLVAAVALGSCEESPIEPPVPTTIVLSTDETVIVIGDSTFVGAQVVDQDGNVIPTDSTTQVLWSSDNPSVVRVTRSGQEARLLGLAAGTATVTAKFATLTATIEVTVLGAAEVRVTPGSAQLLINSVYPLTAQVLGPGGESIATTIRWTTTDASIASLSATSGVAVNAVGSGLGTTTVVARALDVADTITVQVVPDDRHLTAVLNIVADTVRTDTHTPPNRFPVLEYRAYNGSGTDVCQGLELALLADSTVITHEQDAGGDCEIDVTPLGAGSTWLTASVNDVRDSVWVDVTDIQYFAEFLREPDSLVAGDTVSYTVRVYDEGDNPRPNVDVNFNLDVIESDQEPVGNLSNKTVVTDSVGEATVTWYLPIEVNVFPSATIQFEFGAEVPNLDVVGDTIRPELLPGPAADFVFYDDSPLTDTLTTLVTKIGFPERAFWLQAYDRFGNLVDTDVDAFAVSDPDVAEIRVEPTYPGHVTEPSAQIVVTSGLTKPGANTLTVLQDGHTEAISAPVLAGPEVVYTSTGTDEVFVSQIEVAFGVEVYDGTLTTHYPVWTTRRDTVAFLIEDPAGEWGVYTVAADGTELATPTAVLTPDVHATYPWGFPVFTTRSGTAGDVVFISDSLGADESNVHLFDRSAGTATKVTANDHPYVTYHGLSLSPDEQRVLVTTETFIHADPDSSVISNVFEVDLGSGTVTQITDNTDQTYQGEYRYAGYSPDGTAIWVDRFGPAVERELLVFAGGTYTKFIVDEGQADTFQPTFNPLDGSVVAWLDAGEVMFTSTQDGVVIAGLTAVEAFSWSRR